MNLLMGSRFWDAVRVALVAVALVVAGCLAWCAQPAAEPAAQPEMVAQQGAPVEGDGAEDEAPSPTAGAVATPSSAGALQVVGARLYDQAGNPVQLRGVSTHGLAWYPGYVNPDFFTELRRNWNANVVRLALYTAENGGWCEGGNRDELYNLVRNRMAEAVRAGLPVFVSEFGIWEASSTGTFDWTATMADRWEADGQKFFRYVITVTNKGDSAVTSWNVRLPLSGTVTISDSWNATASVGGAELTLDSVSYNGALAPQAAAQDIGFILSGNALPNSGPITS